MTLLSVQSDLKVKLDPTSSLFNCLHPNRFDIDALGAVRLKVLLKKLGLCKKKNLDTTDDIMRSTVPPRNEDLKSMCFKCITSGKV